VAEVPQRRGAGAEGKDVARRAVVVGAGIGGLAAAAALARGGWEVSIHERSPSLEPVGAGLSLWPNALRALDVLGVGDAVRASAVLGGGTGIRRPDGSWLARSDIADAVRQRFGDPLVVLARSELTDLLAHLLPPASLHPGCDVTAVRSGGAEVPARVELIGGDELETDLVVAADGISSGIRRALFPGHPAPVYAGYTTWRFIARAPGVASGWETWGPRGQRFAMVPMAADRVYCYATATAPAGAEPGDQVAELGRRFGRWHDPVPEVLADLRPGQVLRHDVFELAQPLPTFAAGRVALVGDCAHAMTPELGQGGCLALEDAVTLAISVGPGEGSGGDLSAALARYSALRLPRTRRLARRSRTTGRVTQASGRVGTVLRDASVRVSGHLPAALIARGLDPVVQWWPPSEA
jgi:2-polyprenyl-6-methoxyphenol hydroxylase-like FAD-dependent oxidoreductase